MRKTHHLNSSTPLLLSATLVMLSLSSCGPKVQYYPVKMTTAEITNHAPKTQRLKPRTLTTQEKQIAAKLGYDPKILTQVLNALDPEVGIVTALMDGEFDQLQEDNDTEKYVFRGDDIAATPLLEKDLEIYHNIARQHPELKGLIDQEIYLHQANPSKKVSAADLARSRKFAMAVRKVSALLRQEAEDKNLETETDAFILVKPPDYSSDKDVNEKIAVLENKVKGISLRDDNKPRSVLGLRYKCSGNPLYAEDARLSDLQRQLEGSGYKISLTGRNKVEPKTFESRADAERYLSSYGLTHIDPTVMTEQEARKTESRYVEASSPAAGAGVPFQLGNLKMEQSPVLLNKVLQNMPGAKMRIPPGSKVKKLGDDKWEIDQPARYEARAPIMNAILIKIPKDDFGLTLIKAEGTNGINYGLDTNKIIAKLKDWHAKYGISVLSATFESMTVKFKTLPPDLDPLLSEAIAFDPDLNDCGSEDQAKEALGEELKRTGTISFWWD